MRKSYFNLKFQEFKDKFNVFFVHLKKIRALENFCMVSDFPGARYIRLIRELLKDGFLDQKEEDFLDYQLQKAEIDAFTWAHKTKWLKAEMGRIASERPIKENPQLALPFIPDMSSQTRIPLHLLKKSSNAKSARL